MKTVLPRLGLFFWSLQLAWAQDGGGALPLGTDEMSAAQRQGIHQHLQTQISALQAQGLILPKTEAAVSFGWPLRASSGLKDAGYHGVSNYVDQDASGSFKDFTCGNRTYDGHNGTDFFIAPFPWLKMDQNAVEVIAAADGTILSKTDGNYDRRCDWTTDPNWNAIYVRHDDGTVSWYGHLKRASLTSKAQGQRVVKGEYLGLVGSSGKSTGPHLHFEAYNPNGALIDPYAGACNGRNTTTGWLSQPPYYDSALNALKTHTAPPNFPSCPNPEQTYEKSAFMPGSKIVLAAYFRDQQAGHAVTYRLVTPSGTVYQTWNQTMNVYYAASYWYWTFTLPNNLALGFWRFEADYQGKTVRQTFQISSFVETENEQPTQNLVSMVYPNPVQKEGFLDLKAAQSQVIKAYIYNALGQKVVRVFEGEVSGQALQQFRLDTAGLPSGVYLLQVEGKDFRSHRSFVVQH